MMPDTSNVQDFSLIEPAWYPAKVEATEEKESRKGNTYAEIELVLDDGRHVWARLSYVEAALFKLKQFKIACGGQDSDTMISSYIGKHLEIYIDNEEYEYEKDGEKHKATSNSVNQFRPIGSISTNPVDPDALPWEG